ncbi:glycerol-3-phosphate responsive antiterminator [Halarsenatibacter silvermanii]|uniref:Glycerol uptake operon antiterminator n=1 Tax=Halarsenatibacter silvermanii TaxID=321763 RepID=A0A1G9H9S6_9FIRM|nr:glycerol-3-phosphate responsive antiterminator [Halarsenatibacter silvermanii]SDL09660.1 glycerol uptake operon antiterminator [Halarsenatibacter silvermanii]
MQHLSNYLEDHPVIAGVRGEQALKRALNSDVIIIFLLEADLINIPEMVRRIKENDQLVFIHLDLVKGLANDRQAVDYLAEKELCDGLVSTRGNVIRAAREKDLMAVQRLFLLDSAAIKSGRDMLNSNRPDAVEILPGIAAPYFIESVKKSCPVIGGGLIRTKDEVQELVDEGLFAVSTSKQKLWHKD